MAEPDENEEAAYKRLKKVIELVSDAANGIAEENRSDTPSVYNAFNHHIREFKEREAIISKFKWIPWVIKVFATFKLAAGP